MFYRNFLSLNSLVILFNYLDTTPQAKHRFKYLLCINKDDWLIDWLIDFNFLEDNVCDKNREKNCLSRSSLKF